MLPHDLAISAPLQAYNFYNNDNSNASTHLQPESSYADDTPAPTPVYSGKTGVELAQPPPAVAACDQFGFSATSAANPNQGVSTDGTTTVDLAKYLQLPTSPQVYPTSPTSPMSPTVPFSDSFPLEWSDITYTVDAKEGEKRILDHVSARAPVGEITAIMGPSGFRFFNKVEMWFL